MIALRILTLILALCVPFWFEFYQDHSLGELGQILSDRSDPRPARRILIIGNRRTSDNDMPAMMRAIADSASAPQKYEMLLIAPEGASFESLSDNWRVEREVAQTWDDVVFQGESRGQSSSWQDANFLASGTDLIEASRPDRAHAWLIVNWAYDPSAYAQSARHPGGSRADHVHRMQNAHAEIARRTGARLINVGKLWENLRATVPDVALTTDTNRPTVAASYFVALCLYAKLSGTDVARVKWAPRDLADATARRIRTFVDQNRSGL